jgi:phage head maturation protease
MTRTTSGPPTGQIAHRFASAGPTTYDAASHSCTIVISAGAAVQRFYGIEKLRIDARSVDLSRIATSGVPLLDSHSQAGINAVLGRIDNAWITSGQLLGKATFAQTPQGRLAENMVATGMLKGVSAGYSISEFEITDPDGDIIDPETQMRWDDTENTFTAVRWQLLEASLVSVPADQLSAVRSFGGAATGDLVDVQARMLARQRMHERSAAYHDSRAVIGNTGRPAGTAWRRASRIFP